MGGPTKPNRTKNNARPSSSSRSAELLTNQPRKIFGVKAVKDNLVSGEIDAAVDANFQLALKKMGKKDSTTKLKALQEFTELCNRAGGDEVRAILPCWPRLYGQLCNDTEHRVREAAHVSHKAVISKVKKQLAPYLKEIIGPWYSAQFDTYSPAASAAVAAFNEAFSANKMSDAVAFCQEEILGYFHQNIIVHTQQTLSSPKVHSPEEMEDRYRRMVSSSLYAYASFLSQVTAESLEASTESNAKITSSPKFWKLIQNKDPLIRHSFLKVFISLCQHSKWLLLAESAKVSSTIFNYLSDEDPLVLPLLWEAVLNGVVAVPECWENNNVEKQLIPKLFQILRSGGKGNATTIFPNILPLLSAMPSKKMGDKSQFISNLFASMRAGMLEPSVKSQSESRIVALTFVESLQYVVMTNREEEGLTEQIVKEQLVFAIESFWNTQPNPLTLTPFYCQVAQMLRVWYRNASSYQHTIENFWKCLKDLYEQKLSEEILQDQLKCLLESQTACLAVLVNPKKYSRTRERVRFSTGNNDSSADASASGEEPVAAFDVALLAFAQDTAVRYLDKFSSAKESLYLRAVLDIGKSFDVGLIYQVASSKCNLYDIFCTCLELNVDREITVPLGLQFLSHLPQEMQESIVTKLSERDSPDLVLLCRGLSSCSSPIIKQWIKSDTFSKMYLTVLTDFLTGQVQTSESDHLCAFLSPVPIVSEQCQREILEKMCEKISDEGTVLKHLNILLDACGRDICMTQPFKTLVVKIFCLSCTESGQSYFSLLSASLVKMKVFSNTMWTDVAKDMSCEIFTIPYDVERVVTSVGKLIEIALDVDLSVACDGEEVKEASELLRLFLEPPPWIWSCALNLKEKALEAVELNGRCSLKYFELKQNPRNEAQSFDEETMARDLEPAMMLGYRDAHISSRCVSTISCLDQQQAAAYVKWLQLSRELVQSILSSYPLNIKSVESGKEKGCVFVVNGNSEVLSDASSGDVVPWHISNDQWKEMDEEMRVASVFSRDDYPDENMIMTLSNCLLDVLEGAAVLEAITNLVLEVIDYQEMNATITSLQSELQWTIASMTPREFEFMYTFCRTLVTSEPEWCALKPQLIPLFHRRFTGCDEHLSRTSVEAKVKEVVASPGLTGSRRNILQLLHVVETHAHAISLDQWNAAFIQLENILKRVQPSEMSTCDLADVASVSSFFMATQRCFLNCLKRNDEERLAPELIQMWDDVVEMELWRNLHTIWRYLFPRWKPLDQPLTPPFKDKSVEELVAMRQLCQVVTSPTVKNPPIADLANSSYVEDLAQLLLSPYSFLQLTAYSTLLALVPEFVQIDGLAFQTTVADEADEDKAVFSRARDCKWTLNRFANVLTSLQTVVEALLSDFKLGDTCTVQPFTDAYTYSHGYLLLCSLILEICGNANVALRFQYGAWMKNSGFLPVMLKTVFNFMPASVYGDVKDTNKLFIECDEYGIYAVPTSSWIERRACCLYRKSLEWLAASVRDWYTDADHHAAGLVAQVTSTHVSPLLIASELKTVQEASASELENIAIAVSVPAREVIGTYVIDEASVQIIISLPTNYPLGTIKVDFRGHSAILRARKIAMILVHRNGSIRDALALWKSDLNKKFEGIDECEICFSILHGPNLDIPKQACKTCRKKFHSACLYKWFSTSNKSTCPHCRNQF